MFISFMPCAKQHASLAINILTPSAKITTLCLRMQPCVRHSILPVSVASHAMWATGHRVEPRLCSATTVQRIKRSLHKPQSKVSMEFSPGDSIVALRLPQREDMLTPGATGPVSLHETVLRQLLSTGSQNFAMVLSDALRTPDDNAILVTIMSVAPPPEGSDYLIAQCWAKTRVKLHHPDINSPSEFFTTTIKAEVRDTVVQTHEQRVNLAEAEWQIWLAHLETSRLTRRLKQSDSTLPLPDEQKVQIFAPKHYDRRIKEDEWLKTPDVTREIWCQRAENFSFAVMRCMHANHDELWQAMCSNVTLDRLLLVADCIQREQARIYAQLSLKDALG